MSLSCTLTIRVKNGLISELNAVELATEITPVEEFIAKAPLVFPEIIENVKVWFASGSAAITVPAIVPFTEFLDTDND